MPLALVPLLMVQLGAFGPGTFPGNPEDAWAVEGGRRQGRVGLVLALVKTSC